MKLHLKALILAIALTLALPFTALNAVAGSAAQSKSGSVFSSVALTVGAAVFVIRKRRA